MVFVTKVKAELGWYFTSVLPLNRCKLREINIQIMQWPILFSNVIETQLSWQDNTVQLKMAPNGHSEPMLSQNIKSGKSVLFWKT